MNNIQLSRNNSVRPLRLSHTWMVFFKETKINKGELQGVHGFSQNVQICRELRWSSISDSQICLFFYLLFCIGVYPITEKAMAPHSSTLAWQIPWMGEPGGLKSMGSLGVGHDWATSLSLFTFMHWRRKWQPSPVFLPGESQGQRSLVGCRLWGRTESDMTEAT